MRVGRATQTVGTWHDPKPEITPATPSAPRSDGRLRTGLGAGRAMGGDPGTVHAQRKRAHNAPFRS